MEKIEKITKMLVADKVAEKHVKIYEAIKEAIIRSWEMDATAHAEANKATEEILDLFNES